MSTLTSQILIGHPHPNHDGIEPTHYMFLSENSRPAWILVEENLLRAPSEKPQRITWIPTIENMVDDALLMISLYIIKDKELTDKADAYFKKGIVGGIELYNDINKSDLKKLYSLNKKVLQQYKHLKIIVTVFVDSTIHKLIYAFGEYPIDMEICAPQYARLYSQWNNEIRIEGALPRSRGKITKY